MYVSHPAVQAGAMLLVGIEFFAGLFFVIGYNVRYAAMTITGLLLLFLVVMIPQVAVGEELACGCFGAINQETIGASLLVRNVILSILMLPFLSRKEHPVSIDAMMKRKGKTQWNQ